MNKKISALLAGLFITIWGLTNGAGVPSSQTAAVIESNNAKNLTKGTNVMSTAASEIKIKLIFNNEEVIVKLYNNPSSRDFWALLPLTLTFQDYAGVEKISYLPRKLSTKDAPAGCTPTTGDFTYYSPWGNLAIFCKNFQYSNGLIILGKIESGIEKLANMRSDFTVKIEKVD